MSLLDFMRNQKKTKKEQPASEPSAEPQQERKSLLEIAREAEEKERLEREAALNENEPEPMEEQNEVFPLETDFYQIHFEKTEGLTVFDSKLGGTPYWDSSADYPADEKGSPLLLLLQLNFDKLNLNDERLPDSGMLQFFISADASCEGKAIYREKINYNAEPKAFPAMPSSGGFSPVIAEARITLKRAEQEETADGHKIFGTPAFCQDDPRENLSAKDMEYFDTLLLQVDSDFNNGDPIVIWGDSGVANFFINQKALRARYFSRVLYNWDCY